jgi:hypothetical protein
MAETSIFKRSGSQNEQDITAGGDTTAILLDLRVS